MHPAINRKHLPYAWASLCFVCDGLGGLGGGVGFGGGAGFTAVFLLTAGDLPLCSATSNELPLLPLLPGDRGGGGLLLEN